MYIYMYIYIYIYKCMYNTLFITHISHHTCISNNKSTFNFSFILVFFISIFFFHLSFSGCLVYFHFCPSSFTRTHAILFENEMPILWATTDTNNVVYRNIFFPLFTTLQMTFGLYSYFSSYPITRFFFFYSDTDFHRNKVAIDFFFSLSY
uniref:Uncharacterized protein n=1 Tax=Sipha flava TaxID=143950 RepID=A0A2S2QM96_9HEMI